MDFETWEKRMKKGINKERSKAIVFLCLGCFCLNKAYNYIWRKGFKEGILASDIHANDLGLWDTFGPNDDGREKR